MPAPWASALECLHRIDLTADLGGAVVAEQGAVLVPSRDDQCFGAPATARFRSASGRYATPPQFACSNAPRSVIW